MPDAEQAAAIYADQLNQLGMALMESIVNTIRQAGEITSSADYQMERLYGLGMSKAQIRSMLQAALNVTDEEMEDLYKEVAQQYYVRDAKLYTAQGVPQIPFAENQPLLQLVKAQAVQTAGTMRNLSNSIGFLYRNPDGSTRFTKAADYYWKTVDRAVQELVTGAYDYNTVIAKAVRDMTGSGLRVIEFESGTTRRADGHIRTVVMTGASQIAGKIAEQNMDALHTEYVEVDYHSGARPSHQVWQGKVFRWNKGTDGRTAASVPEIPQSDGGNSLNLLDNSGESGIIKTSRAVSGALNPDSSRAEEHAERYYGLVRNMKTDVSRIAQNTGYSEEFVQSIKNFIFMEKHDLGDGVINYFAPDYKMAESWQRLIDGKNIQPHDLTLLKHEEMERNLMKQGYTQDEAHDLTSQTYNYAKEANAYHDKIKKHKKN